MSEGIRYSRGAHKHDNTPEQREAEDFAAFYDAIEADRASAKGLQWIAAPAGVAPDDAKHRSSESMAAAIGRPHRCKDCVGSRAWLGLDADKIQGAEAFHALVALLAQYNGRVWPTHSHSPEAPRCRVILELDAEGDRDQIIAASKAMRARVDAQMVAAGYQPIGWDESCDRPEQPLYLPPTGADVYRLDDGKRLPLRELVAEAGQPETAKRTPFELSAGITEGDAYAVAALRRAAQALAATVPGERNKVLNRESYGLGGFVGAGRLSFARVCEALDAATEGWDNPAKTRGTIRGGIASGTAAPRVDGLPPPQHAALRRVPLGDVMARKFPPHAHVLARYFPRRVVTLLGGHGGVGKSMLALTLAAHVAAGCRWESLQVEQGRVVFLSFEDEAEEVVLPRLQHVIEGYALPAELVLGNLEVFDGSDGETELALETPSGGLEFTPMMALVEEAVQGAALVIIDNASDTYGANENARRQVRAFVRRLTKIAKANNAAVVLLAHVDKQAAKGGGKGNNYSGSSQWNNSVRSRLALVDSESGIELVHEKVNYGPLHSLVSLRREDHGVLFPIGAAEAAAAKANAEALVAQADASVVLGLVLSTLEAGDIVPTATTGPRTSWHVLSLLGDAPAWVKAKTGKRRVEAALLALAREGQIKREGWRNPRTRHVTDCWTRGG